MPYSGRFPLHPCLPAALVLFLCACSDSPDTADHSGKALRTREKNARIFPYSHNPQRLARFGPDSCVNCHEKAVNDWKQSHHAKANRPVSVAKDATAFTPSRQIEESGVTYEMAMEGDAFRLKVVAEDGGTEIYDLVGVIGETPIRSTRKCITQPPSS